MAQRGISDTVFGRSCSSDSSAKTDLDDRALAAGAVKVEEAQGGGGGGEDAIAGGGIAAKFVAPDPDRVKALTDRTGYAITVTPGQRKYGGPPPNWEADRPPGDGSGCEVKKTVKGISTSYT